MKNVEKPFLGTQFVQTIPKDVWMQQKFYSVVQTIVYAGDNTDQNGGRHLILGT